MPPAYALELLTIFAWEKGCGKDAFSLAQGLQAVLSLIQQYQHLCVFWTTSYGFEDPAVKEFLLRQLERPRTCRPVILDPADPTWDVGNGATWAWDLLAQEAESCCDRLCFLQAVGGAVKPWEVPIPSRELDHVIQDHLKPNTSFQRQVSEAIDVILGCLREKRVHRASRVSKGGHSAGAQTSGVAAMPNLSSSSAASRTTRTRGPRHTEILNDMRAQLESWWQDPVPGLTLSFPEQTMTKTLQFRLVAPDLESWMDVSLLPIFDAVGQLSSGIKPDPQIYCTLLDSGCQEGEHAACFAELRRNFVNTRPVKLKNLIPLVKHWYRQVAAQIRGEWPACASLPPAYAPELLTIFTWEQGAREHRVHMAKGLRTILGLVQQQQQLRVFWTVNYSFEDPALRMHLLGQLRKPRPLILDPADPTWNVGQDSWEPLAWEAATLETQACLMSREGIPVQPWDVTPTLLHQTPDRDLDKFINDVLQPDHQFLGQVHKAVDTICSFLRENCFKNFPIRVLKVVKGGSSAKGTALRGHSDADLVVFLSCFHQFRSREQAGGDHLGDPGPAGEMQAGAAVPSEVRDLQASWRPHPRVSVDLIRSCSNAGECSCCFTELQWDFLVSRPTKLKSLI